MDKCECCHQEYDFSKYASATCLTHKKHYCYECWEKSLPQCGIERKEACHYGIIINPQWVAKLKSLLNDPVQTD